MDKFYHHQLTYCLLTLEILDYDAPLTECGNYTEKYHSALSKIAEYDPISSLINRPDLPEIIEPVKYGDIEIIEQIDFEDILNNVVSTLLCNSSCERNIM